MERAPSGAREKVKMCRLADFSSLFVPKILAANGQQRFPLTLGADKRKKDDDEGGKRAVDEQGE